MPENPPSSHCLRHFRQESHPHCVVCGPNNGRGLQLTCTALPDGSVEGAFACARLFEGYERTVHGGVICSLLDGAMTNCLFAHGRIGLTAELRVRFLRPVSTERPVVVRARITNSYRHLYYLSAELRQDGEVMATATAKFLERPREYQSKLVAH